MIKIYYFILMIKCDLNLVVLNFILCQYISIKNKIHILNIYNNLKYDAAMNMSWLFKKEKKKKKNTLFKVENWFLHTSSMKLINISGIK